MNFVIPKVSLIEYKL